MVRALASVLLCCAVVAVVGVDARRSVVAAPPVFADAPSAASLAHVVAEQFPAHVLASRTSASGGWRVQSSGGRPLMRLVDDNNGDGAAAFELPSSYRHPVTLALRLRNAERLAAEHEAISRPSSPRWRAHMSWSSLCALVAPTNETRAAVLEFLARAHPSHVERVEVVGECGDFVRLHASPAAVRAMFGARLVRFEHAATRHTVVRSASLEYRLPAALAPHVAFATGLARLPPVHSLRSSLTDAAPRADARASAGASTIVVKGADAGVVVAGLPGSSDEYVVNASLVAASRFDATNDGGAAPVVYVPTSYTLDADGEHYTAVFSSLPQYAMVDVRVAARAAPQSLVARSTVFTAQWATPQRLVDYYHVPPASTVNRDADNAQAVAEFLGQYYSEDDLRLWFVEMGLQPEHAARVVGPNDPSHPGGEASLDIQYLMGVHRNTTTEYWSTGGLHEGQEPFVQWLVDALNTANGTRAFVHSVSYDDQEGDLSVDYVTRIDQELMKAGARGLSILFAAGDDGAGGFHVRSGAACTKASPAYPATSAYATSIGGTMWTRNVRPFCNGFTPAAGEWACSAVGEAVSDTAAGSRITTGGGFSALFPVPSWQRAAAAEYTATFLNAPQPPNAPPPPPSSFFTASGRIYPDVSAVAHAYPVLIDGVMDSVDGTSASTPTIAAFVAMLNDQLLSQGETPLGFLNYLLYEVFAAPDARAAAYTDVTWGNNRCSADPTHCCAHAFAAVAGFDATTGLGSPRVDAWQTILQQLIDGQRANK